MDDFLEDMEKILKDTTVVSNRHAQVLGLTLLFHYECYKECEKRGLLTMEAFYEERNLLKEGK